ncbi:MAG: bacteriophage Gp15 family protein [Galactobacillus timonensis]|uniref:bacteriophage Gp15 family protein n=1 Tax=Clostridium vitabionis TaxID=2784388 RepID=UPI001889E065|nr:bacteriophage Gp15 family protein [Clostridium vitabionis]MDD5851578.1 bacteriophage Gp15 family protein [Galactobacillus timonensis]
MNLLIDGLPETVNIAGEKVPIEAGFRTGILFEEAINDATMSDEEKVITMLGLYFPRIELTEETVKPAAEAALWFYRCGDDKPLPKNDDEGEPGKRSFSYEYDADYIYAGFMEAYGIDLTQKNLHWWQFHALFRALPETTQIVKIIGYRTMRIPKHCSKEQRDHIQRMKRIYALPDEYTQSPQEADLTALLMRGGNPESLLRNSKNG